MMRLGRAVGMTGAVVVALAATTGQCNASFIPQFKDVTSSGGVFTYSYELEFATSPGGQKLISGDFVTIYDFNGFTGPTSTQVTVPANFSASTSLLGVNAPFTNVPDSATIPNITLMYTGPDISVDTTFSPFTINSTVGPTTMMGVFTGRTLKTVDGMSQLGNAGNVLVPGATVPEPSSVILTGLGAIGVLGMLRFRKPSA